MLEPCVFVIQTHKVVITKMVIEEREFIFMTYPTRQGGILQQYKREVRSSST
jgi:hypothetical protein